MVQESTNSLCSRTFLADLLRPAGGIGGLSRSMIATALFAIFVVANSACAATLVVAQVGPMSGLHATQGSAYAAGMQLEFERVNSSGGVNGHTITLVKRDDAGRPQDTVGLTKQALAENQPIALAGYFGSENIRQLLASGLLDKWGIALVGYRGSELRSDSPNLFSVRAGLREELNKITEHLGMIGITRLGLLVEAGPEFDVVVSETDRAAKAAKLTVDVRASYPAKTASVAEAVGAFLRRPPQAIIMVSSGAASAAFIEQYRGVGGAAQLFAHSGADIEQLSKRLAEEQMQGVAIAQVTPSPYKITTRLAKEFSNAVAKTKHLEVPVSFSMMEGFITARVITESIRRQGPNPSRKGVLAALQDMGDFDSGGYLVSYRPGQQLGSRFVELSIVTAS
ncbi:Extracellular ligand-binding receptor, partial [Acidovorax delafieldii 2AN]